MRHISYLKTATDYYAFGSPLIGRTFEADTLNGYRFGINTQEKDDEIYGKGNASSAEFWEYDTRLGRRWNLDPVDREYESTYSCFYNNPMSFSDIDGDEPEKRFGFLKRAWNSITGKTELNKANKYAADHKIEENNVKYNKKLGLAVVIEFVKINNSEVSSDGTASGESTVEIKATFFTDGFTKTKDYFDLVDSKLITDGYTKELTGHDFKFNTNASLDFNWDGYAIQSHLSYGYGPAEILSGGAGTANKIFKAERLAEGGIKLGKEISQKTAILRLQKSKDIYTHSKSLSKELYKKAQGGGRKVIKDEAHGTGYFNHFHDKLRKIKAHSFFGKSKT